MTPPSGRLLPEDDRARRAIKALDEQRLDDAAKHIAAMPDDSVASRAWKFYLSGRLAWAQHDINAAEASLTNCINSLNSNKPNRKDSTEPDGMRLSAAAHELLGSVLRRQDRPVESLQHHQSAYQLRHDFGTPDELFESATNIGTTYRILRKEHEAKNWFEQSKQHAENCAPGNRALVATALSNLATVYDAGQPHDALIAAREARAIWYENDPESPEALLADVLLGCTLLNIGQSQIELADPKAAETLTEAIRNLSEIHVALLACGAEYRETAALVSEKLDFAKRLVCSLNPEP